MGSKVVAAEVSVLAKVDLDPWTDEGVELALSLKAPPALTDSAARESAAMGPEDSDFVAGSEVFCYV